MRTQCLVMIFWMLLEYVSNKFLTIGVWALLRFGYLRYDSDLTDKKWEIVTQIFTHTKKADTSKNTTNTTNKRSKIPQQNRLPIAHATPQKIPQPQNRKLTLHLCHKNDLSKDSLSNYTHNSF